MNTSRNSPPGLQPLLRRLRPFQLEAFEFATKIHSKNSIGPVNGEKSSISGSRTVLDNRHDDNCDIDDGGRLLLADEMGLGKTVTSLAIMMAYIDEWPLLVLCPASLRHTWPAEIEKFLPSLPHSSIYVVSGFDDSDFYSNPNKRARIKIVVATYSLLQNRSAAARVLKEFQFKCIIVDESHNLKERNSQRCKLAMPLCKEAKRLLFLSGTPALARPVELWAQLHCINSELFGSYTAFTKQYCNARRGRFGWDVSGCSHPDELHDKLRSVMVRRLKSDVLKELPPKQRSIVPVKIQNEHLKICRELIANMKEARISLKSLVGEEASGVNFEAKSLLMQSYQASGIGKAQAVADYVLDWLRGSGTQKVIVFAHHIGVLNTIEAAVSKFLKGAGHIRIDGSVPSAERASRVKKFQNKGQVRLALLSVTAAGVGLTLTAASSVIFAELHWTPGVLAQAEDRCHRIGQANAVNIVYCVCKDREVSVDLSLWEMLGRKVGNLGRIIDGERGASMNAKDATVGVTAEQEVATFFANTCPLESSSVAKHSPVKGSIQSFFIKKKPANILTKESTTNKEISAITPDKNCQQSSCITSSPLRLIAKKPVLIIPTAPKALISLEEQSWTCTLCTFVNEKASVELLNCEICGTLRVVNVGKKDTSKYSASCDTIVATTRSNEVIIISDEDKRTETRGVSKAEKRKLYYDLSSETQHDEIEVISSDKLLKSSELNLAFSLSKNSGRVSVHNADGSPLCVNFDIEDIIEETTSEQLLQQAAKRTKGLSQFSNTKLDVNFNHESVEKVISSICSSCYSSQKLQDKEMELYQEVKVFVSKYLPLREVEKKAIREWGEPMACLSVKESLRKILLSDVSYSQKERYSGGYKERALENASAGVASKRDKAVLSGHACAWCGCDFSEASLQRGVQSTYCSKECAEEGRLRRGGLYASTRVRSQVFSLEAGICQKCGLDTTALFLRIASLQPAERLNALCNVNWHLPKSGQALERLLQNPKEGDFWQADHIVAVAEGGGGCGLENLRTLCTPCHRIETQKLNHRLRLEGSSSTILSSNTKAKNMDIRTAFLRCKQNDNSPKTSANKRHN